MKCPGCQKENEPASRFCIFCGSPLYPSEAGGGSELSPVAEHTSQQPPTVEQELRRLREQVASINNRLAAVERRQGTAVSALEPVMPSAITPPPEAAPVPAGAIAAPTTTYPPPGTPAEPVFS